MKTETLHALIIIAELLILAGCSAILTKAFLTIYKHFKS
jgi:hypothetical protein